MVSMVMNNYQESKEKAAFTLGQGLKVEGFKGFSLEILLAFLYSVYRYQYFT